MGGSIINAVHRTLSEWHWGGGLQHFDGEAKSLGVRQRLRQQAGLGAAPPHHTRRCEAQCGRAWMERRLSVRLQ